MIAQYEFLNFVIVAEDVIANFASTLSLLNYPEFG